MLAPIGSNVPTAAVNFLLFVVNTELQHFSSAHSLNADTAPKHGPHQHFLPPNKFSSWQVCLIILQPSTGDTDLTAGSIREFTITTVTCRSSLGIQRTWYLTKVPPFLLIYGSVLLEPAITPLLAKVQWQMALVLPFLVLCTHKQPFTLQLLRTAHGAFTRSSAQRGSVPLRQCHTRGAQGLFTTLAGRSFTSLNTSRTAPGESLGVPWHSRACPPLTPAPVPS